MLKQLTSLFILTILTCSIANAEEIKVAGGGAAISSVFLPIKEPFEKATGDKLTVIMSTPVAGLKALMADQVDIATCAYPFDELLEMAAKEKFIVEPSNFWSLIIAKNQIVVFLHKSNPVKELSQKQLKGIFTGKIKNWNDVGGPNLPIIVIWGAKTAGQNARFVHQILDDGALTANATIATDYKGIRDLVSTTPGGIGIDPLGFKSGEISAPKVPIIESPIIIVTKGAPSAKVQKLIDFYRRDVLYIE